MYPYQYMTAGMCFLPDSTKEFNVCDHLGSVRMIVRVKNDTITYKHYDYKPFGDTLNADKEERLGYLADEKDKENNYIMMNFRTYDSKTGRFLSVDPLFESMPGQSPYNYSYNNPMGYADPSGLKPEKAKGDKIQGELDWIQTGPSCDTEPGAGHWEWTDDDEWGPMSSRVAEGSGMGNRLGCGIGLLDIGFGFGGGSGYGIGGGGVSKNGVYGTNNRSRNAIKSSVEDKYEYLIQFDDNGKVIFPFGNIASEIAKNHPKSNFAKLYQMATNDRGFSLYISFLERDETEIDLYKIVTQNYDNGTSRTYEQANMCNSFESIDTYNNYAGKTFGLEFSGEYNENISTSYGSFDHQNHIYLCTDITSDLEPGIYGHELYYHGWGDYKNLNTDDRGWTIEQYKNSPEYKKAGKH